MNKKVSLINNNLLDKTTLLISGPYLLGGQPDDSRITIEEQTVDAPDYTEGEKNWQRSTLTIDTLKRTDDGLYECQAVNDGGKFFQSGHLTVEFRPMFEDQKTTKELAWDHRQTNLTSWGIVHCLF